jgi:S1-C subfamily serine protease
VENRLSFQLVRAWIPVTALIASLVAGACDSAAPTAEKAVASTVTAGSPESPVQAFSVADVVEEALPSVVNVRVKSLQGGLLGGVEEAEAQGSGVVTDTAGLIVTNNHFVQCAGECLGSPPTG